MNNIDLSTKIAAASAEVKELHQAYCFALAAGNPRHIIAAKEAHQIAMRDLGALIKKRQKRQKSTKPIAIVD